MEIRFNPLIAAEADAVRRFLTPGDVTQRVADILGKISPAHSATVEIIGEVAAATITPAALHPHDNPETGADAAQSAIPLPPSAPSSAAADLFPIAHEAPTAGIPLPPGAALPPVPPVPAVPPAPTAPVAPTSLAGGVETDADGLPWNAEIHAGSKTKNADGRWRQRRNLDPAILERVTAQLRALMAIPAASATVGGSVEIAPPAMAPAAPPVPLPSSASTASPVTIPTPPVPVAPPQAVPAPPIAPPPVAQAPAPAPAQGEPVTFAQVMRQVTEGLTARKFTEAQVNEALKKIGGGVPIAMGQLAARLDLAADLSRELHALSAA